MKSILLLNRWKKSSIPSAIQSICEAVRLLYPRSLKSIENKIGNPALDKLLLKCCPDKDVDAETKGKGSLQTKCVSGLQRRMMFKHFSISQLSYNMGKCTDSSKQRVRLRGKITTEKAELMTSVVVYNKISDGDDVNIEDVASGVFKWIDESEVVSYSKELPIRTKRLVAEKWMETKRFEEEQHLLKTEMSNYLTYYKTLLLTLHREKSELETALKEVEQNTLAEQNQRSLTYATSSSTLPVTHGKICITKQGEDFSLTQLSRGINAFSDALDGRIDEYEQLLVDEQSDSENDLEKDVSEDESDSDINNIDNHSLLMHDVDTDLECVTGEKVGDGGVICWKFPASVSQSTLAETDGSNACSIIATLLGHRFVEEDPEIPDVVTAPLPLYWVDAICKCIRIGNMVYNNFRDTLPNRYLSVEEAIEILSGVITAEVTEVLPVRFLDTHKPSTVEQQLELLLDSEKGVALLIIHERTFAFLVKDGKIIYVDSHLHPPSGAIFVSGSKENLHDFCNYIWNLESYDPYQFGNLARTSYKDA